MVLRRNVSSASLIGTESEERIDHALLVLRDVLEGAPYK